MAEGTEAPARPGASSDGGHLGILVVITVLWGFNWPAMKLAVDGFDPWTFRSLVLVLASATLFLVAYGRGDRIGLPREAWLPILLPAATVSAWHVLSAYGVGIVGGGRAAIIAFTMPLWASILSVFWLGERMNAARAGALVMGLAGLGLLLLDDVARLRDAPLGVVLMLLAAVSWAIGTVAVKAFAWGVNAIVLTAWQLAIGAAPILIVWAALGASFDLATATTSAVLGLAYTTFVAMVFCFCGYVWLVTVLPATVAAISTMAIPAIGLLGSAWLLGEPIDAPEIAALACVAGGQALLYLPRRWVG